MSDTRRDFIKKAALLTGAAGMSSILPLSIQKALAIDPSRGSTYMDAEHIVFLMQENRSFDHCFGTLRGVRGFDDPRAIDLPNKNKVWLQSNNKGETFAPFRLDIKNTRATWMDSIPHSWDNQVSARNDGKYNNWIEAKRPDEIPAYRDIPQTLGYHTREDIPFYYAMADAFTVCDQYFCSSLTGTSPNRTFFWAGTVRAEQDENSRALVWNEDIDYAGLNFKTFPERLEENGISWKCYQNEISIGVGFETEEDAWLSNYGDNQLEYFAQYNPHLHPQHIAYLERAKISLAKEIEDLKKGIAAANEKEKEELAKKLGEKQQALDEITANVPKYKDRLKKLGNFDKSLHKRAFDTNISDPDYHALETLNYEDNGRQRSLQAPKGDVLHSFRKDVESGNLPVVSWIVAPKNFSDHPAAPWYGAWYVSEVLDILTKDPEVWKKTIFILNYDENDGYFDHVPPFTAPNAHQPGTGKVSEGIDTRVEYVTRQQELARHDFPQKFDGECSIGLGYRVPMIIASPWSRGGWVNSEVFDHTSALQFLEHFLSNKTGKNILETNISQWRRTICGDLTSAFRPYNGEKPVLPGNFDRDKFLEYIHSSKFKKVPYYKILTAGEIAQFNTNSASSPYHPQQEKGMRISCGLPYQLHAEGRLNTGMKAFEIKFEARNEVFGNKALGSPFNVYAPGKYLKKNAASTDDFEDVRTWAYAVKAGDAITYQWPLHEFENHQYHLRAYGPNGFYREYAGNADDPALAVSFDYETVAGNGKKLTGNIVLNLTSHSPVEHLIIIADAYTSNRYKLAVKPNQTIARVIGLDKSHNWYDVTLKVNGHDQFRRHYAGRVETGKSGFSDPQIGAAV